MRRKSSDIVPPARTDQNTKHLLNNSSGLSVKVMPFSHGTRLPEKKPSKGEKGVVGVDYCAAGKERERARSDQWQKTSILHNSFHLRAGNVYVIASEVVAEAQVSPLSHRFRPQLDNGINHPNLNAVLSIAAQFPCGCRAICALDRMRIFPVD